MRCLLPLVRNEEIFRSVRADACALLSGGSGMLIDVSDAECLAIDYSHGGRIDTRRFTGAGDSKGTASESECGARTPIDSRGCPMRY